MANGLPIDIDTFRALGTTDAKLDALFTVLVHMNAAGYECEGDRELRLKRCEDRFKAIEQRKKFDTGIATTMGLIGGAVAWFCQWMIGKE